MKIVTLLISITLFSLISCVNSENEDSKDSGIQINDTITDKEVKRDNSTDSIINSELIDEEIAPADEKADSLFNKYTDYFIPINNFPIIIDSIFIAETQDNEHTELHSEHIPFIFANPAKLDVNLPSSLNWIVSRFLIIDSVKQINKYDDFLEKKPDWDIQHISGLLLNKFKLNKTQCYIWSFSYSTSEVCPYSEGTNIIISFVQNKQIIATYQIGNETEGGEPPYWDYDSFYTTIDKDGRFYIKTKKIFTKEDIITDQRIKNYYYKWDGKSLVSENK